MTESKDPIDILLVLKQDSSLELILAHIRVSAHIAIASTTPIPFFQELYTMRTFAQAMSEHGDFGAVWKKEMKNALNAIHHREKPAGPERTPIARERKSAWTLHSSENPTTPWLFMLKVKVSELLLTIRPLILQL
jgi:hypothetical protein